MANIYESKFHKEYVRGEGEVRERETPRTEPIPVRGMTYEEIREEYRWYMRNPNAELPKEIIEELVMMGKIKWEDLS